MEAKERKRKEEKEARLRLLKLKFEQEASKAEERAIREAKAAEEDARVIA